jgi:hypothetical protein
MVVAGGVTCISNSAQRAPVKNLYSIYEQATFWVMDLPSEIVCLVIHEATCVPAAFDTSFESIVMEDTEAVDDAIRELMKPKLSLCLMSRCFHEIAIEFLYEIITV